MSSGLRQPADSLRSPRFFPKTGRGSPRSRSRGSPSEACDSKRTATGGSNVKIRLIRGFRGYSLRERFLVAPLLGLLVSSFITAAFIYESQRQNALLSRIMLRDLAAFNQYAEVFVNLAGQHTELYDLLTKAPAFDEAALYDHAKKHLYRVEQSIGGLERALPSLDKSKTADSAALRRELSLSVQAYRKGVSAAVAMATLDAAIAPGHLTYANEHFLAMNRSFMRLLELERTEIVSEIAGRVRQSRSDTLTIALVGVLVAIFLFFVSLLLSRLLSRSIAGQIDILTDLGAQAGARIPAEEIDEVDRMAGALAAFKESLSRIQRLNRVYAMRSQSSALIVRAKGHQELYERACHIAVDAGGFRMAWIGEVERDAMKIIPMA